MERTPNYPLQPPPSGIAPEQVIVTNTGLNAAPKDPPAAPVKLADRLTALFALLLASLDDGSKNAEFLTAVAGFVDSFNLRVGCDPMRMPIALSPYHEKVVPAWNEVFDNQSTLLGERPGIFRRIDMKRVNDDLGQIQIIDALIKIFTHGLEDLDALRRHYAAELIPPAVQLYVTNRDLITTHSKLRNDMPALTALAVGTGQQAAASRAKNKGSDDSDTADGGNPPAAAAPASGSSVTVITPAPPALDSAQPDSRRRF